MADNPPRIWTLDWNDNSRLALGPPTPTPRKLDPATTFDETDLDEGDQWKSGAGNHFKFRKRDYYRHLKGYNNGWKEGINRTDSIHFRRKDNRELIEIIADTLCLTSIEANRARGLFSSLDLSKQGIDKVTVGVAVCLWAVESNKATDHRGHPQAGNSSEDRFYDLGELAEEFSLNERSLQGKVHGILQEWEYNDSSSTDKSTFEP